MRKQKKMESETRRLLRCYDEIKTKIAILWPKDVDSKLVFMGSYPLL